MEKFGKITYPGQGIEFVVTKRLIESGQDNLVLNKNSLPIVCPMILIQGMQDTSVYWKKALKIAELAQTQNVKIKLLKNANHRLNEDSDIQEILSSLNSFLCF